MATAKKKTDAPSTRTAPRPQAERRVEAAPAPAAHAAREPSHDAVARRAFELWEQHGRRPGRDLEHWLQAEAELRGA
jgi:hypothetical protein